MDETSLKLLIPEAEITRRVAELAERINRDCAGRELVVVGLLQGAFIFLADLARRLRGDLVIDFLWIASYRGTTPGAPVRLLRDLETDIAGKDVLIVEDVVDSGASLRFVREHLAAKGPRSLRACALLDKGLAPASEAPEYVAFRIDPAFVVGYGLDLDGRFRHLPGIHRVVQRETDHAL